MRFPGFKPSSIAIAAFLLLAGFAGCGAKTEPPSVASAQPAPPAAVQAAPSADDAMPPESTGGFDGRRALAQVAKQVQMGPRQAGTPGIAPLQAYIAAELKSYGCPVETDDFHADTPVGSLAMKNIVAKIPGERRDIIVLATHYDTKRLENFVGADDGGSSTAVMLEIARVLCAGRKPGEPWGGRDTVWIAFFDGEEAVNTIWKDPDNCYGSRQMAARMAASGDLKRTRALLLADIVGNPHLLFRRESASTKWLTDLIWSVAAKLGYGDIFINESAAVEDDHVSFLKRGVPSADVINDFGALGYWHTPHDTLDKISARSLAIVGHVFLESLREIEKSHPGR